MRSSPAAIAIRLLQTGGGMLALVLLWWTAGRRLDGWTGAVVDVAFWTYVVLRPLGVPLSWLLSTYVIDDRGVRSRRGWLVREETEVGWDEVVAVDVSQPFLHRLFGCYAVRLGLGSASKPAVRIEAVRRTEQERIVAAARAARLEVGPLRPPATAAEPDAVAQHPRPTSSAPPAGDEVYRARRRDYLLIAVAHGQFVLFVPAALSLVDQVQDWVPLPLPDPGALLAWSLPQQLGALLGVLVASVAYGWLHAWLRFRGFRVVRDAEGWTASGGLLSSETRTVAARHVTGLKVTQNPLMRALGRGRVSVLTQDAGEQPMANLLFPVVRLASLPAALGTALPVNPEIVAPTLRLRRSARVSLGAGAVLVAAALVGVAYAVRPGWLVASVSVVVVAVALWTNARWVVATTVPERSRCYARRGLFWVSHLELDLAALHVVESSQGPLGRFSRTWSVVLHYYDGRVRRLRAPGCDAERRAALAATVLR